MKQTKRFLLSFLAMMLCAIASAQVEVKGTVVDETGEGVIGATAATDDVDKALVRCHRCHSNGERNV